MAKIPATTSKTADYQGSSGKPRTKSRATTPEAIYSGRTYPTGTSRDGDGLVSGKRHQYEVMIQKPQDPNMDDADNRNANYDNEVPTDGPRAWLRGGGSGHRAKGFDGGGSDVGKAAKSLRGGGNCEKSPFSAAGKNFGKGS